MIKLKSLGEQRDRDAYSLYPSNRPSHVPQRPWSFITGREASKDSSVGDESDSTSTSSSSTASSASPHSFQVDADMPAALEYRLRLFRSVRGPHPPPTFDLSTEDDPDTTWHGNIQALREGTFIHLSSQMVTMNCGPDSLSIASAVTKSLVEEVSLSLQS